MRIFVVDNHDVLRRGLRILLSGHPGWVVCGDAKTGTEAVRLTLELHPELVTIDLDLPDLNGIEVTRRIKEALPATEVLFFTTHEEDHVIAEALKAGARAYVLKSDSEDKLIEGVEALASHLPFFSTRASEMLLNHLLTNGVESDQVRILTEREREIVQLLAGGKSNKDAASRLRISVKTVETHRAAVMRKLGFKSITDLVRYAIRNKLIEP
ncbi:MAG TPA: response regulator transcription factor [Terriglobia bacterium]|nr:response regulator transcription factor [Terriglobia bacterium]